MEEPIMSPDGNWLWTGEEWIPAPPSTSNGSPGIDITDIDRKLQSLWGIRFAYGLSSGVSGYLLLQLFRSFFDQSSCKTGSDIDCIEYSYFGYPIYAETLFTNLGVLIIVSSLALLAVFLRWNEKKLCNGEIEDKDIYGFIRYLFFIVGGVTFAVSLISLLDNNACNYVHPAYQQSGCHTYILTNNVRLSLNFIGDHLFTMLALVVLFGVYCGLLIKKYFEPRF